MSQTSDNGSGGDEEEHGAPVAPSSLPNMRRPPCDTGTHR